MTAPNACAHCGVEQRDHMQRWVLGVGWHQWVEPPDWQRKERMLARRANALKTRSESWRSSRLRELPGGDK